MLFEMGRTAFGSMVIGILLRGNISDDILLTAGVAVVAVFFILSLILGRREIKDEQTPVPGSKRRKR